MKSEPKWWIKECSRAPGQKKPDYIAFGLMTSRAAREEGKLNVFPGVMHGYATERAYNLRLEELRNQGAKIY